MEGGEPEIWGTHQQLLEILRSLTRVSHDKLPSNSSRDWDSSSIKALLELRTYPGSILSANPLRFSLSQRLSELSDLVHELHNSKPSRKGPISFVARRIRSHEVSRLAAEIESELQALIDGETVSNLTKTLSGMRRFSVNFLPSSSDEDKLVDQMSVFQDMLTRGFNINLQDMLLRSGIFEELEWVLCNPLFSNRVRENAAVSMQELVLFNKDVFVGSVLVGGTVEALVSIGCLCSLQVLSSLVKAIKSPLVDELESCGGILKVIGYLSSDNLELRVTAMDCLMEIAYFGRKKAVEAMMNGGLVKKLVELQRSELGGDLIDLGKSRDEVTCKSRDVCSEDETRHAPGMYGRCREMKYLRGHPFASCVARLAVQLEVGEGLRQREKRSFKQQILNKIRQGCVSEAECATIVAEVLWGSSP